MKRHRKQIQQHPGAAAIADRVARQRAGVVYGIVTPEGGDLVRVQGEEYPSEAAFYARYPAGRIIKIIYEEMQPTGRAGL
jgi:hypothetical protein